MSALWTYDVVNAVNEQYNILSLERGYLSGLVVSDSERELLLGIPPSIKWLAEHRFYEDQDFWPGEMSEREFRLAPHLSPLDSEVACMLGWGSFRLISLELRQIFEKFEVVAFYTPAKLYLSKSSFRSMLLWVPGLAVNSIDRSASEYQEDPESPPVNRILSISKLVLSDSALAERPPLLQLAGTSQNIVLVRSDLCEAIESLGQPGLKFRKIQDCTWDY